jgi:hypothetical protein
VLGNRASGQSFDCGESIRVDHARHGDEGTAACAMQVVVVCADQLEAGKSIIEHQLAHDAFCYELFGGPEHRGEICRRSVPREASLKLFKSPGVALTPFHHSYDRGGNSRFSCHVAF